MIEMHSFWRSAASYRVRAAFNLKGLAVRERFVDLDRGEQHAPAYRRINPQGALPTVLFPDGTRLTQSLAILEYLDETHPEPPLLPPDRSGRARVRSLALLWAADHHPLIVPRVRHRLRVEHGFDDEADRRWVRHWFGEGLRIGEERLAAEPETSRFCHGDRPTLADLCLASHVAGARHFGAPVDHEAPTMARIEATLLALPAFADAHPSRQPGAPGSGDTTG